MRIHALASLVMAIAVFPVVAEAQAGMAQPASAGNGVPTLPLHPPGSAGGNWQSRPTAPNGNWQGHHMGPNHNWQGNASHQGNWRWGGQRFRGSPGFRVYQAPWFGSGWGSPGWGYPGWSGRDWGDRSWGNDGWDGRGSWMRGHHAKPGFFLPRLWLNDTYIVSDWARYGLPRPNDGQNWVRYYDDAALVDERGMIYDSVGIDWERYGPTPDPQDQPYGGPPDDYSGPSDGFGSNYSYDQDDRVTWHGGSEWATGRTIFVPSGSVTTIVIQSQPVVTTTTTIYYEEEAAPVVHSKWRPRAVAKAKVRHRAPVRRPAKPPCTCAS